MIAADATRGAHWRSAVASIVLVLLLIVSQRAGAQFENGKDAYDRGDHATAYGIWLPLAEAGDPEAQFWIGELLAYGKGIERDSQKARTYYLKAAYQGHGKAQRAAAGLLYPLDNKATETEKALHFTLNLRAATNGVTSAYVSISSAYCFGNGVDENPLLADIWMALAMGPFAERLDVMQGLFCDIFGKNDEKYLRQVIRRAALLKEAYGLTTDPPPDWYGADGSRQ